MLTVRPATAADARQLWEWANDPDVRAMAFSPEPIGWDGHLEWLSAKLGDASCLLLVALDGQGRPVGQVRFDRTSPTDATIDVSVARHSRGNGYAAAILEAGLREFFSRFPAHRVHALVKRENVPSRRAFERAAFARLGEEVVRGYDVVHYTRVHPGPCDACP